MRRYYAEPCVLVCLIAVFSVLNTTEGDTNLDDGVRTRYKDILMKFNNARTHGTTAQETKLNETRAMLVDKFKKFGLTTIEQHFSSNKTNIKGQMANGANVVAILKGRNFNTSQDRPIVFVAHMDTHGSLSWGVNNDGSGLTAMLTLAEDMAGTSCKRDHTVVFVALDFTEIDDHGLYCPSSCGTEMFIKSLPQFIGNGQIQLVFVMKCILNFDNRPQSQIYNSAFQNYFHTIFHNSGLLYSNRGNFIAAVGRKDEESLVKKFEDTFNKQAKPVNDEYVIQKFVYNFTGSSIDNSAVQTFPPNDSYTMYLNFWKKNIKAILLTDTCYARGKNDYMQACQSQGGCDTIGEVFDNRLGLMHAVILSLRNMTEELVGGNCADVNECALGTAKCSVNSSCTNTLGSYRCVCKPGYSGDGLTCIALPDKCAGVTCGTNAVCAVSDGKAECVCKKGFECKRSSSTLNKATAVLVQILAFGLAIFLTRPGA